MPGTIIRRNEKRENAVKRAAREELGKEIIIKKELGVYESIVPFRHDISNAFIVKFKNKGSIKTDFQGEEFKFFEKLPSRVPKHHKKMILDARRVL